MKLSIIIPVYNEENAVKQIINKVKETSLSIDKEIIVVDDGSTDKTAESLRKIGGVVLLKHNKNKGKGAAIITGLSNVTGDIVLIQDADLEYDPKDYNALIEPFLRNNAEVVYGSRTLGKNEKGHWSFHLGGWGLTVFANLLYGLNITDEATCYKVFKTDLLRSLNLESKGFEFCPEVTAKIGKRKIKIYEVPISYYPRSKKEGKKIKWKDGFIALWVLFKNRF